MEYKLEIIDSIQVDYMGNPTIGEFYQGRGVIYDHKSATIIAFDTLGNILSSNQFPKEGPGSLSWIGGMRIHSDGKVFVNTLIGEIGVLDENLELEKKIQMPFPPELRDMWGNSKVFDFWKDYLYIYYPGRDGQNPYLRDFWKENTLLEQIEVSTGDTKGVLKLPSQSKHQSDLFFEQPSPKVGIQGEKLYLHLDTENLIFVYDLGNDGEIMEVLDFQPSKYVQLEGQTERVGYASGNYMSRGRSNNLFPIREGLIIYYSEGIAKDDFVNAGLNKKENWYKRPDMERKVLKIYSDKSGWSNEIILPPKVGEILNIEALDKSFFGFRNDEYLGVEQDFVTFYKLKLNAY
ncbi:hypothetical protein [Pleomorphovibrio marinus]|uniref:hypothetical protein n=1 Tax=Pleomorphovibrio marinus TaxID=2164132 RepID=UPI0013005153|nr:hypothetical protein [Pleomorphovibrio marinus]